jgi:hypothetical protein
VLIVFKETTVMKLKFLFTSVSILGLCAFSPSSIFASEQENIERSDFAPRPSSSIAQEEKGKEKEAADSHSTFSGITSEDVTRFVEDPTLWNNKNLNGHPIMGRYAEETDIAALINHLTGSTKEDPKALCTAGILSLRIWESQMAENERAMDAFHRITTLAANLFPQLASIAEEDFEAQFLMGHTLRLGLGADRNSEESIKWWMAFAKRASCAQLIAIGEECLFGTTLPFKNNLKAFRDLTAAVQFFKMAEESVGSADLYNSIVEYEDPDLPMFLRKNTSNLGKAFKNKTLAMLGSNKIDEILNIYLSIIDEEIKGPNRIDAVLYFYKQIMGKTGTTIYTVANATTWKEQEHGNEYSFFKRLLDSDLFGDPKVFIGDFIQNSLAVRMSQLLEVRKIIQWIHASPTPLSTTSLGITVSATFDATEINSSAAFLAKRATELEKLMKEISGQDATTEKK